VNPPDTDAVPPLHWVFGYGSLIYKVDFPYVERRQSHIVGWERRFWQGSHDHRGTPEAPGRVVTLIPHDHAHCWGMAYLIEHSVFEHLDYREKNGYVRIDTPVYFMDGTEAEGTVYIAAEDNQAFLGEAPIEEIARHIMQSAGPSGNNTEYLLDLADALRELGTEDEHVFELERLLLARY
jgi:cation transport protein ChaC